MAAPLFCKFELLTSDNIKVKKKFCMRPDHWEANFIILYSEYRQLTFLLAHEDSHRCILQVRSVDCSWDI